MSNDEGFDIEQEKRRKGSARLSLAVWKGREARTWQKIVPQRKKVEATPRAQLKVHRATLVLLWAIAIVFLLVGLILLIIGVVELISFQGASQASCEINDYVRQPMEDWTDVCSNCLFYIQGLSADHGIFYVRGWKIEFSTSYRNSLTAKPAHEEFDCCPTEPDLDCCRFYKPDAGLFCDNWGPIQADCREGTWPCYIFDLKGKLEGGEGVKADELFVGEIDAWMPMFIAGNLLCFFGLVGVLFLALPCQKAKSCLMKMCGVLGSAFSQNTKARVFTKVPEKMRTTEMWTVIMQYKAAICIQRYVRKWLARRPRSKQEVEAAAAVARSTRGTNPFGWGYAKDLRACSLAEPQGDRCLIPPPPPDTKSKRIFYDTGNVDTFCKLVRFRVASSPKEDLQRVEMAVMEDLEAEQLSGVLKIPPGDEDSRPMVVGTMRGTSFELSGVSEGWRLLKAGQFVWPRATGRQMLQAIQKAARPLFLVFEGRPTDLNMALFVERVEPSKLRALSRPTPPKGSARSRVSTPTKPVPPESTAGFVRTRHSPLSQRSTSSSGPMSHRSDGAELKQPSARAHLLQPLALPAPLDLPQAGLLMPPEPPPSPPRQPPPWEAPTLLALEAPPAAEAPGAGAGQKRTQSARGAARTPSTGRTGDSGTPKGEASRIKSSSLVSPMSGRGGSRQRRRPCSGGLRSRAEHVMGRRARSLSFPRTVCQPRSRPASAFMAPETPARRPFSAGRNPQPPRAAPPSAGALGMMSARQTVELT